MGWIFTISIIIVLVIVGFMLFFFMPKPQVFYQPYTNTIAVFPKFHDKIKEEVSNVESAPVIPIYGFGEIVSRDYPFTYELLRCLPYVRFAGIITIKPKFQQAKEYSYAPVANHTIRYFYTVQESGGHKSGIWIDGEKRFFVEKEWICGDMSREHSLFNKDKERASIVIFVDIDRHESIHEGRSPNLNDIDKDEILRIFEPGSSRRELINEESDQLETVADTEDGGADNRIINRSGDGTVNRLDDRTGVDLGYSN